MEYKYKNRLVDLEKHFKGEIWMTTKKSVVLFLDIYRGKKYIPLNKVVFSEGGK